MARSLWTGSLSFGLVNVPVALFSAVRDLDLHFRQLHGKDGSPIDIRRFCSKEDREVAYEEIAHGYELDDGKLVVITDEELESVAPRKTRTIDIEAFVDVEQIDPAYLDHPYFLAPAGETEGTLRAYRLLVEAMGGSDRAALGRFVLRAKEYLVAIRVREGRLTLSTMLFGDEVRPTKEIEVRGAKPKKAALDQAVALIETLSTAWDPTAYEDCYRKRLMEVIKRKKQGKTIKAPEPEEETEEAIPDLMAALERSLAEAKERQKAGKA
jgi:DNA end-binding protein Ku